MENGDLHFLAALSQGRSPTYTMNWKLRKPPSESGRLGKSMNPLPLLRVGTNYRQSIAAPYFIHYLWKWIATINANNSKNMSRISQLSIRTEQWTGSATVTCGWQVKYGERYLIAWLQARHITQHVASASSLAQRSSTSESYKYSNTCDIAWLISRPSYFSVFCPPYRLILVSFSYFSLARPFFLSAYIYFISSFYLSPFRNFYYFLFFFFPFTFFIMQYIWIHSLNLSSSVFPVPFSFPPIHFLS